MRSSSRSASKSVEPLRLTAMDQRRQILATAHWNLFRVPAEAILIDLLTDSAPARCPSPESLRGVRIVERAAHVRDFTAKLEPLTAVHS